MSPIENFCILNQLRHNQYIEITEKLKNIDPEATIVDKPTNICSRIINFIVRNIFGFYRNTHFATVSCYVKNYFTSKLQNQISVFTRTQLNKILDTLNVLQNRWMHKPNFFKNEISAINLAIENQYNKITSELDFQRKLIAEKEFAIGSLNDNVLKKDGAFNDANKEAIQLREKLVHVQTLLAAQETEFKTKEAEYKSKEAAAKAREESNLIKEQILRSREDMCGVREKDIAVREKRLETEKEAFEKSKEKENSSDSHIESASSSNSGSPEPVVDVERVPKPFDQLTLSPVTERRESLASKSSVAQDLIQTLVVEPTTAFSGSPTIIAAEPIPAPSTPEEPDTLEPLLTNTSNVTFRRRTTPYYPTVPVPVISTVTVAAVAEQTAKHFEEAAPTADVSKPTKNAAFHGVYLLADDCNKIKFKGNSVQYIKIGHVAIVATPESSKTPYQLVQIIPSNPLSEAQYKDHFSYYNELGVAVCKHKSHFQQVEEGSETMEYLKKHFHTEILEKQFPKFAVKK
jgi:hypothetical protein